MNRHSLRNAVGVTLLVVVAGVVAAIAAPPQSDPALRQPGTYQTVLAFDVADTNGDGVLTPTEIRDHHLTGIGIKSAPDGAGGRLTLSQFSAATNRPIG